MGHLRSTAVGLVSCQVADVLTALVHWGVGTTKGGTKRAGTATTARRTTVHTFHVTSARHAVSIIARTVLLC